MQSISIGELQKNISLLTQLTDVFAIVDKRKKQRVAIVYPVQKHSVIASMAGKYRDRVTKCDDLEHAKEMAMMEAMGEKYGFSN
ncbi:MAG: hypothetical protein K0U38_11020 [Epsilonproteobacteria bacterium]|nr:hypothetical protein [Campylobacterota bacterium]